MPKSKWQELLGHSGAQSLSQKDMVRQLTSASAGGGEGAGTTDLSVMSGGGSGATGGGGLQGGGGDSSEQISSLATQLSNLTSTEQTQISATQANTQAVTQNTSSKGSGSSVAGQVGSAAESLFGGALSLSPILSGIASLFGGGSSTATPMVPFSLPPAVQNQAGLTAASGGQVSPVSYGAGGQPRQQTSSPTTQVTVQVNAMDSQSFLDHSDDIAQAVKQALLNSNSLGDVIADL
jgi:hypothetical protein